MKPISISAAKNTLSAIIQQVRRGATVTITDRGVPVARIVPPAPTTGIPAWAVELAHRGVLTLPEREPTANWGEDVPAAVELPPGVSAVQALLEERSSGW